MIVLSFNESNNSFSKSIFFLSSDAVGSSKIIISLSQNNAKAINNLFLSPIERILGNLLMLMLYKFTFSRY